MGLGPCYYPKKKVDSVIIILNHNIGWNIDENVQLYGKEDEIAGICLEISNKEQKLIGCICKIV